MCLHTVSRHMRFLPAQPRRRPPAAVDLLLIFPTLYPHSTHQPTRRWSRPYFGVLAPMLRQRGGSKELFYHRVQAAYRALLALVR